MCLEAQNINHSDEQVWCLNPYEDVSRHEENPHGEGRWKVEAEAYNERYKEIDGVAGKVVF